MKKNTFSPSLQEHLLPNQVIEQVTKALYSSTALSVGSGKCKEHCMPSLDVLHEVMDRLRMALFPGYYGKVAHVGESFCYHLSANLDSVFRLMKTQILHGLCFVCSDAENSCEGCDTKAEELSIQFMLALPAVRELLMGDVLAAYRGDPAAKTPGETIFCYPSIAAMTNQRLAHVLYGLGVPLIPRILTEMAHSKTGIDIHPGAQIGKEFFIDHGTGVVIGETCIIGDKCRLYQGVTLGALSFKSDENEMLVKGQQRHPVLGDNVTVYAGATILGRISIGSGSIIGGNVWLTHGVPEGSRIVQQRSVEPEKTEKIMGSMGNDA